MTNAVQHQWNLSKCDPQNLRGSFERSYRELSAEQKISRPLNANMIILDYVNTEETMTGEQRATRWAEFFAEYNPGRIFYFVKRDPGIGLSLPDGSVHSDGLISGGVVIQGDDGRGRYSDMVFGRLNEYEPKAFLSLVRGQYQVGFRPNIVLVGAPDQNGLVEALSEDAASILFSSRFWSGAPRLFSRLAESDIELVDLEWLHISGWRAQLRNLALKHDLSKAQELLSKIKLTTAKAEVGVIPPAGALFLGWLVSQFHSRILSLSRQGIECITAAGKKWIIEHRAESPKVSCALSELEMSFDEAHGAPESAPLSVHIRLNDNYYFETDLTTRGGAFHFTGSNRDYTTIQDLKRYFTRGESTVTYREALTAGREIGDFLTSSISSFE
ncbi:MAG: glucose-6-phosphate dehydrogenase assembly protein OpcA [Bdellovibrionales bacterium]|nr:glucose-6-phosphate dehydrogenase assembly protein OpcA [Bdellovibrionales bacterium]